VRWSTRTPVLARGYFHASHLMARRMPRRLIGLSASQVEGADKGALVALGDWFPQVMAEAVADGPGAVDDYQAYAAPWGFRPEDVDVPVDLYQGTDDALVPKAWADELHRRLPSHRGVASARGDGAPTLHRWAVSRRPRRSRHARPDHEETRS
jgi:pimeloyl-ACP methyl ester carboxylesterase